MAKSTRPKSSGRSAAVQFTIHHPLSIAILATLLIILVYVTIVISFKLTFP